MTFEHCRAIFVSEAKNVDLKVWRAALLTALIGLVAIPSMAAPASSSVVSPLKIIAVEVAKPGSADALRKILIAAVPKFRAEPGCRGYVLMEDRKQPGRFMTYETWTDEAALTAHMKGPTITALLPELMGVLDLPKTSQSFLSVIADD